MRNFLHSKLIKLKNIKLVFGFGNLALLIIAVISSSMAIYGFSLQAKLRDMVEMQSAKIDELVNAKKEIYFSQNDKENQNLIAINELSGLVKDLVNYKNTVVPLSNQVLGTEDLTPSPAPKYLGVIILKSDIESANLYNDTTTNNVVAKVDAGKPLFYTAKADGWYQIELDNGVVGWIQAEFVNDLQ